MFRLSPEIFNLIVMGFLFILGVGLILTYDKKSKKATKNISRMSSFKSVNDDEILARIRNEAAYSEEFKKHGYSLIKSNTQLTANIISSLKIDFKNLDLIIARADEKEITAEELAVKKVIGMIGALLIGTLGILINYIFFILALVVYLYFAVNPIEKLNKKHKIKQAEFKETMPSYLRLVANATAVGNPIEEALRKVGNKYPCVIEKEINKAALEAAYSNDWLQALLNVSFKADIPEFEQMVSEIRITKEKGTSITDILLKLADKVEKENAYDMEALARQKASTIIFPVFMLLFAPMLAGILLPVSTIVGQIL